MQAAVCSFAFAQQDPAHSGDDTSARTAGFHAAEVWGEAGGGGGAHLGLAREALPLQALEERAHVLHASGPPSAGGAGGGWRSGAARPGLPAPGAGPGRRGRTPSQASGRQDSARTTGLRVVSSDMDAPGPAHLSLCRARSVAMSPTTTRASWPCAARSRRLRSSRRSDTWWPRMEGCRRVVRAPLFTCNNVPARPARVAPGHGPLPEQADAGNPAKGRPHLAQPPHVSVQRGGAAPRDLAPLRVPRRRQHLGAGAVACSPGAIDCLRAASTDSGLRAAMTQRSSLRPCNQQGARPRSTLHVARPDPN